MKHESAYYLSNETEINNILIRCAMVLLFVGPLVALLKAVGLNNEFSYLESVIFTGIVFILYILCRVVQRSMRAQWLIKYVLILGMHTGICYMATKEGILLYISYALMPALSCLYYRRRFTLHITAMCYAIMMASLFLRAHNEVSEAYDFLTEREWISVFGFSLTWEYILLTIVLIALVGKTESSLDLLHKNNLQMKDMQSQLITGFANFLEFRDEDTGHHVRRTQAYVKMIAMGMYNHGYYQSELSARSIAYMETAAPLHDVGKIAIRDSILLKEGELTENEYEIIKNHTKEGYRLVTENLSGLTDKRLLKCAQEITLSHHERWDGTGYPNGLKGTAIPLSARIMAIADTLDAMLSERVYKKSMDLDEVLHELYLERGRHFEPCIVDTVIQLRSEIEEFLLEDQSKYGDAVDSRENGMK
ncbi:MAG: HD domain-containing protein [Lachnospiraceae bacterium]|nr:HD domain-containing protein [Lachnospiraceae bacterium]